MALKDLEAYIEGRLQDVPCIFLGENEGMPVGDYVGGVFPAGVQTNDHKLWFSTGVGIAELDPARVTATKNQCQAVLTAVKCNNDTVSGHNQYTLPAGVIHLEFYFTAATLSNPEKLQFRYKLDGYDHDWNESQDHRVAHYTKVPPGHYKFIVQVTNQKDKWSEEITEVPVIIEPFFYQTWWFMACCALAHHDLSSQASP
jgi:hypothetical protein